MERYMRITLCVLMCIGTQLHAAAEASAAHWIGHKIVLKDPVVEMGTSVVPKIGDPICPDTPGSCVRAHQGLLSEVCTCVAVRDRGENGDELQVRFDSIIYGFDRETEAPLGNFWMKKAQALLYDELPEHKAEAVPVSVGVCDESVVTLIHPWKQFSLGTRFKRAEYFDTNNAYAILVPNYDAQSTLIDFVSHRDAWVNNYRTPQEARAKFVWLLNDAVDSAAEEGEDQVMAYGWGCSSRRRTYTQGEFELKDGAWYRPDNGECHSGYDCSGLAMRLAQIAGVMSELGDTDIIFPWKTTGAMKKGMAPVESLDALRAGDFIWIPGHVMIISNKSKCEVIEARGYASGWGCVHRTTLSDLFDGIETWEDLWARCESKQPIRFKDKQGVVLAKEHGPCELLKLVQ